MEAADRQKVREWTVFAKIMKIGIFGGTFNPPHKGHARMVEKMTEEQYLLKNVVQSVADKMYVEFTFLNKDK